MKNSSMFIMHLCVLACARIFIIYKVSHALLAKKIKEVRRR